jgi:hypothetical protein
MGSQVQTTELGGESQLARALSIHRVRVGAARRAIVIRGELPRAAMDGPGTPIAAVASHPPVAPERRGT